MIATSAAGSACADNRRSRGSLIPALACDRQRMRTVDHRFELRDSLAFERPGRKFVHQLSVRHSWRATSLRRSQARPGYYGRPTRKLLPPRPPTGHAKLWSGSGQRRIPPTLRACSPLSRQATLPSPCRLDYDCGVLASSAHLLFGSHASRLQAETPLCSLSRFAEAPLAGYPNQSSGLPITATAIQLATYMRSPGALG